jgi:hypothetical protein
LVQLVDRVCAAHGIVPFTDGPLTEKATANT